MCSGRKREPPTATCHNAAGEARHDRSDSYQKTIEALSLVHSTSFAQHVTTMFFPAFRRDACAIAGVVEPIEHRHDLLTVGIWRPAGTYKTIVCCLISAPAAACEGVSRSCVHKMGKCYVANVPAHTGRDLFSHPLFDMAVARALACQTNHTDRRRHPRSSLSLPTSIVIAFLTLSRHQTVEKVGRLLCGERSQRAGAGV